MKVTFVEFVFEKPIFYVKFVGDKIRVTDRHGTRDYKNPWTGKGDEDPSKVTCRRWKPRISDARELINYHRASCAVLEPITD